MTETPTVAQMPTYPKIPTVWARDPDTKYRTLIEGRYATVELKMLADLPWVWTEKVDGTNIRVGWDGERIRVGGRTERAQVPTFLFERILDLIKPVALRETFTDLYDFGVVLFGEGYGEKIQKGGGDYIPGGCGFILFDVLVASPDGSIWLTRESIEDIAGKLGLPVVPVVGTGSLLEMVTNVRKGPVSDVAERQRVAEGIVARPAVDLLDRRGQRIITKVKLKDFPQS